MKNKKEKFTREEMATWILDNWKELLPILKEQEQFEIERQQRLAEFKRKVKIFKKKGLW